MNDKGFFFPSLNAGVRVAVVNVYLLNPPKYFTNQGGSYADAKLIEKSSDGVLLIGLQHCPRGNTLRSRSRVPSGPPNIF